MSIVHFNIGGKRYSTSTTTLLRDPRSMLASILNQREEKQLIADGREIFIDRNGKLFSYVLDYLRDGCSNLCLPNDEHLLERLSREADFYQISELTKIVKSKLGKIAKYQPTMKIGIFVKFTVNAMNNLMMQEYFDMMNDVRYADVKFGPDIQDRLETVPCWFCGEPAAQKLKNSALVADNWPRERLAKCEAFLLATWGETKSSNSTCCLVKFLYPSYMGAVVLREDADNMRHFQREPVSHILLHVPIQFLERVTMEKCSSE